VAMKIFRREVWKFRTDIVSPSEEDARKGILPACRLLGLVLHPEDGGSIVLHSAKSHNIILFGACRAVFIVLLSSFVNNRKMLMRSLYCLSVYSSYVFVAF
jgi:hypothetical protein